MMPEASLFEFHLLPGRMHVAKTKRGVCDNAACILHVESEFS